MIYYDSQGNQVEFNGQLTDLKGGNGEIYKLNSDIAYKKYFSYGENKIKQAIFEFLKSVNNHHLVRLLERYYLVKDILDYDDFLYHITHIERDYTLHNQDIKKIDLYTYEWVKLEYIDILELSIDYLLDNINGLIGLADLLSDNYIALSDMKAENVICNRNSIVLIDPDMYYFIDPQDSKSHLKNENRRYIFQIMRSICQRLTEYKSNSISRNITELFESSIESPQSGLILLSKKLAGYKIPLEYALRKE